MVTAGELALLVLNTYDEARCSRLPWSSDINDCSLSLRISYGDVSVCLPADLMQRGTEFSLERFGDRMGCTILKMPHHGIWQANLGALLDRLKPAVAIASASGRDPTPNVLAIYEQRSISVVATRDQGNIFIESDGKQFRIRTAR